MLPVDVTNPGLVSVADQGLRSLALTATSGPGIDPIAAELLARAPFTSLVALGSGIGSPAAGLTAHLKTATAFAEDELVVVDFMSDEVDLTVLGAEVALTPSLPGYYGLNGSSQPIWKTMAGVLSTASMISIGNDAARTNYFGVITSPATTNFTAGGTAIASQVLTIGVPARPLVDLLAPIVLKVTTAATGTGNFVAKAKYVTQLTLVRASSF